jgi:thiamine monophosphate synthase
MQPTDVLAARQAGAQGVAMIRGVWEAAGVAQAVRACIGG